MDVNVLNVRDKGTAVITHALLVANEGNDCILSSISDFKSLFAKDTVVLLPAFGLLFSELGHSISPHHDTLYQCLPVSHDLRI